MDSGSPSLADSDTVTIFVTTVNFAPIVDLDGVPGGGIDVNTAPFTTATSAGVLLAPLALVSDPNPGDLIESLTLVIDGARYQAADPLLINGAASGVDSGLNYSYAAGTMTISGAAAGSVDQTVLRKVTYQNTNPLVGTADRQVSAVAFDGSAATGLQTGATPGFSRNVYVLIGDVNDNAAGTVDSTDLAWINFARSGNVAYQTIYTDIDGDGLWTIADLNLAKANQGKVIP